MDFKRSVIVVDITDFLLYLEDSFYRLSPLFPWLLQSEPIDKHWPWTETNRFLKDKTQRDYLIDWIIRLVLKESYYIDLCQDDYNSEYSQVLGHLEESYQFHENKRRCFQFPLLLGYIEAYEILRQSCWLYVEVGYSPAQQLRHYAPHNPVPSA